MKIAEVEEQQVTSEPVPARPRGRQRSKEADQAILQATRDVLLESGYNGFTINAVVERAGVSTATIYRRWANTNELIFTAISALMPEKTVIDAGSFEQDLSNFIDHVGTILLSIEPLAKMDKKDSRTDPTLRKAVINMFVESQVKLLSDLLERAQQRGELGSLPSVDHCFSYVAGPLHHRLVVRGDAYTASFAAEAKTVMTAGLRALSAHKKNQ